MTRIGLYICLVSIIFGFCNAIHTHSRCIATAEEKAKVESCYKDIMKIDFDVVTFMKNPMTPEQTEGLQHCYIKKSEIIDESGHYDHEKVLKNVETSEYEDPDIKVALLADINKCNENHDHEKVTETAKCVVHAFAKHCVSKE